MSKEPFPGFPVRSTLVPLPDLFFTRLLPEMDSLKEVKLVLHVFRMLSQKKASPKYVSYEELMADRTLLEGMGIGETPEQILQTALESAIERGILLHLSLENGEEREELYFVNTKANKRIVTGLKSEELSLKDTLTDTPDMKEDTLNIFALYEANIGPLTPMIAEELKEAERNFPASWIEEAFKEAVNLNKRSWRYISRILENWDAEGKENGKLRGHSKKTGDPDRFIKGKYGHIVKR